MFTFSPSLRIFLAVVPVDMRKSFNGLFSETTERLSEDPRSGAIFLFTNKRRDRVKILYWDGTGLWVLAKRLEKGRFWWPRSVEGKGRIRLEPEALHLLLSGIDLKHGQMRAWYER